MADFRSLRVWNAAQALAIETHEIGGRMRGRSATTLRDQMVRAGMSIPANIVEGSAHESPLEFARFLRYSIASASELEGHAQLAKDLHMIRPKDFDNLLSNVKAVRKMLHGLVKSLGR